eukprot:5113652-Alexandrium_andersonii.AAC.1
MSASLVGSEMCIRDRTGALQVKSSASARTVLRPRPGSQANPARTGPRSTAPPRHGGTGHRAATALSEGYEAPTSLRIWREAHTVR